MIKCLKNTKGQSTLEFLMSFVFVFGILFLFLKMSFNITNGYFLHYANFMASRAYLTFEDNSNSPASSDVSAAKHAEEVFKIYKAEVAITSTGGKNLKFSSNSPDSDINKVFVGTIVTYKDKFSAMPLIGGDNDMNFTSESFLGREPTRAECIERICTGLSLSFGITDCDSHVTIMDNGC